MKLARRHVVAGCAGIAAIAMVVGGPSVARRLAFFRVRQVEVVGAHYLDEVDVVRRLHLEHGASTFDRLDHVRAAARAIPGVISATVTRRLPGTLRVTLREAAPVALAPLPDRLVLIDSRGHVLPFDPVRVPASYPIIDRDSATAALLGRLMLTDPLLYDAVESARRDHGDVVFDSGPHQIRLRPEADGDVLRAVSTVRTYLGAHGIAWQEIDGRYQARDQIRVFVRKGHA